jgi:phosphate transport system protein
MWRNLLQVFQRREDLYTQALHESYTMLDMDLLMYEASVASLRNSNTGEIQFDVYQTDKQINSYERDVRKKVLIHLSVAGPRNLNAGLVLVSVIIDIERIGDYAKNIYDLARLHPRRLVAGSLEPDLQEIESRVTILFKEMVQAFKTSDVEKSRQIMIRYKENIAGLCDSITERIVQGKATDLSCDAAVTVSLYSRYLKRIAAHSRNIITSVVNPFHRLGYKEKKEESMQPGS